MRSKAATYGSNVDGRIWINIGNETFLGPGKIELLEKIKELGSLRKAAMSMKLSYRQAWNIINEINKRNGKALVILKRGGKNGGMAELTETGEKAIIVFRQLLEDFSGFLAAKTKSLEL